MLLKFLNIKTFTNKFKKNEDKNVYSRVILISGLNTMNNLKKSVKTS